MGGGWLVMMVEVEGIGIDSCERSSSHKRERKDKRMGVILPPDEPLSSDTLVPSFNPFSLSASLPAPGVLGLAGRWL